MQFKMTSPKVEISLDRSRKLAEKCSKSFEYWNLITKAVGLLIFWSCRIDKGIPQNVQFENWDTSETLAMLQSKNYVWNGVEDPTTRGIFPFRSLDIV